MTALSLAPAGAVAQAGEYLRHGDVDNVEQLLRFLADTFLLAGPRLRAAARGRRPRRLPPWRRRRGDRAGDRAPRSRRGPPSACASTARTASPATPPGSTSCARRSRPPGPTRSPSGARRCAVDDDGTVPALDLLDGRVDALITTMLATGGSNAGDAARADGSDEQRWDAAAIEALDVPVIQAVCATSSRAAGRRATAGWRRSTPPRRSRSPSSTAGCSAASSRSRSATRRARPSAWPSRATSPIPSAARASRASPSATPSCAPRRTRTSGVALLLTSFPTKHARVGMAVGLDTPASALGLLDALHEAGYAVQRPFAHGDELMHALVAGGGHDPEFLTDEQLAGATLRCPIARLPAAGTRRCPPRCARRSRSAGARRPATSSSTTATSSWPAWSSATCSSPSSRRAATATIRSASTTTRSCRRPTTTSPATASSTRAGARTRSSTSASTARSSGCRARCSRCRRRARPTRRSATCRSSTRSSSTTRARACRPSAARTR